MPSEPHPMRELLALFKTLDGQSFISYQRLLNKAFDHPLYHLRFIHIQGSPGAFPASVCHLGLTIAGLGLPDRCLSTKPRKMATADYLLRAFRAGVAPHARPRTAGTREATLFSPCPCPPGAGT